MRNIAILGSTGSIGTQTLEVIRNSGNIHVCALAARRNTSLLEEQIREFRPEIAAVYDEDAAADLRQRTADLDIKILSGMEGLIAVSEYGASELLVTGIVGMIGIEPTIAAIRAGKDIALANKETLVCAGHIIIPLAAEKGVRILPVDSEHSAIFQALQGNEGNRIDKILLTASGGPFRGYTKEMLSQVTLEDALKHPNWNMGPKVTIDSSTLANKGLEVMEASWLFGVPVSKVQVVIQPKSIIHSMVQYEDGAVIAQLGTPDMKLPIQYALYYPERKVLPGPRLDFWEMGSIIVEKPDTDTFRALKLAYRAAETGGSLPTVFNAANEYAVARFVERKISYMQITEGIEYAMDAHKVIDSPSLEDILSVKASVDESLDKWLASKA